MTTGSISVVVVNWNHGHLLPACLDALLAQTAPPLEIGIVDNGSHDGSPQWLPRRYPAVRLWAFPENRGFSWALNRGIGYSSGEWVLSLNPDVTARPDFLAGLLEAVQQWHTVPPQRHLGDRGERLGLVAPKLLQAAATDRLDSTGLFIDRRRRPYDRGQGELDRGHYDTQLDVFGACGAAALYRRAMLEDVAVQGQAFDESFFAYCEDADLAWRARLRGWTCIYAPTAVATHARGWGDTLRKAGRTAKGSQGPRLALRNRYLMALKNDRPAYLLADLPLILAAELPRLVYAGVTRPRVLLGLWDLARALPAARAARREIRSRQTTSDAEIRTWFR